VAISLARDENSPKGDRELRFFLVLVIALTPMLAAQNHVPLVGALAREITAQARQFGVYR